MRRLLLVLAGLLQLTNPRLLVARGERIAFENPDAARLRGWTLPMARIEGILALWLTWNWERAWPGLRPILGTIGLPALLTPRPFLALSLATAYENPEEIELRPWVVPFTRLLGLCYVLVAAWPRGSEGEGTDSSA